MKVGNRAPLAPELKTAVRNCKTGIILGAVFSFAINILMLVSPLYMMQIYDRVMTSSSTPTLVLLSLITIGLLGAMAVLEYARGKILSRLASRFDRTLNSRLFDSVFALSLHAPPGQRSQAFNDLTSIRNFLVGPGPAAFFDMPWAPIFITVLFLLHPVLGTITLIGIAILLALTVSAELLTRTPLKSANSFLAESSGFTETNLRNAEALEAMGMRDNIRNRWLRIQEQALCHHATAHERGHLISNISKFVRLTMQTLMLGGGAWLAIHGEISPGMIIAGSIIMGRAMAPIDQAIAAWKSLISARGAIHRLNQILNAHPAALERISLPAPVGVLTAENVAGMPPGSRDVTLRNINFTVSAGEAIGIVGPSGAGKSTLARLLVGIWPAYNGTVRLDGADIAAWNRNELGPHIGYLPQTCELLNGTVAENIARFGSIDDAQIVTAASRAGVHDLILKLPNGYETRVGEQGTALSAGQRQRISLARALYGNPALVVLDEPNSNLDEQGDQALAQALMALKQSRTTVLIISHRPDILRCVDRIMVLTDGVIRDFAPRDEIFARFTRPQQVEKKTA